MIRGLPASFLLHAGVIGFGYIAFPYVNPPREQMVVVPIELVDIGEVNNIAPVVRREEVEPEPEVVPAPSPEELQDLVDALPEEVAPEEDIQEPPPQEPEAAPPPVEEETVPIEPEPEEEEPEEEAPEPEPEPEEPEPEPEEPEIVPPEPETDALDDLLNDPNLFDRTKREPVRAPAPQTPVLRDETQSPEARRGAGDRTGNTARIEAIILAQMKVCWDDIVDLPYPETLPVTVRVKLKPDGTLRSDAELVSPRRAPIGHRYYPIAIERALRATRKCQPYRLPADDYAEWEEVTINFRTGQ